jgi:hypothetical protein
MESIEHSAHSVFLLPLESACSSFSMYISQNTAPAPLQIELPAPLDVPRTARSLPLDTPHSGPQMQLPEAPSNSVIHGPGCTKPLSLFVNQLPG